MRRRVIGIVLALVALVGLSACAGAGAGGGQGAVPTNGSPVMVEFYTDW